MKSQTLPQRVQPLSRLVNLTLEKDLPRLPTDRAHRNWAFRKCPVYLGARRKYGDGLGLSQDPKWDAVRDLNCVSQNLEARDQQLQILFRARILQLTEGRIDLRDIPKCCSLPVLSDIRTTFRRDSYRDGQRNEGAKGLNPSGPVSGFEIEPYPCIHETNGNGGSSRANGPLHSLLHSCLQPLGTAV